MPDANCTRSLSHEVNLSRQFIPILMKARHSSVILFGKMGLLIGYNASKVTLSADIIDVSRIKAGVKRGTAMPSDGSMNTGRGQIQLDHLFSFLPPNEHYNAHFHSRTADHVARRGHAPYPLWHPLPLRCHRTRETHQATRLPCCAEWETHPAWCTRTHAPLTLVTVSPCRNAKDKYLT
jgi:hypothetical protein